MREGSPQLAGQLCIVRPGEAALLLALRGLPSSALGLSAVAHCFKIYAERKCATWVVARPATAGCPACHQETVPRSMMCIPPDDVLRSTGPGPPPGRSPLPWGRLLERAGRAEAMGLRSDHRVLMPPGAPAHVAVCAVREPRAGDPRELSKWQAPRWAWDARRARGLSS